MCLLVYLPMHSPKAAASSARSQNDSVAGIVMVTAPPMRQAAPLRRTQFILGRSARAPANILKKKRHFMNNGCIPDCDKLVTWSQCVGK